MKQVTHESLGVPQRKLLLTQLVCRSTGGNRLLSPRPFPGRNPPPVSGLAESTTRAPSGSKPWTPRSGSSVDRLTLCDSSDGRSCHQGAGRRLVHWSPSLRPDGPIGAWMRLRLDLRVPGERALIALLPRETEPTSWGLNAKKQPSGSEPLFPRSSAHGGLGGKSGVVQQKRQGRESHCIQVAQARSPKGRKVFSEGESVCLWACVSALVCLRLCACACACVCVCVCVCVTGSAKVPSPPREQRDLGGKEPPFRSKCSERVAKPVNPPPGSPCKGSST